MFLIDPHCHMVSRTTADYETMALSGVVAISEPAFWAGYDRSPAGFIDYYRQLTETEPKHWRDPEGYFPVQLWAAGQAVCLRDAMLQLADRITSGAAQPQIDEALVQVEHADDRDGADADLRQGLRVHPGAKCRRANRSAHPGKKRST